jgi:hypothetical protein
MADQEAWTHTLITEEEFTELKDDPLRLLQLLEEKASIAAVNSGTTNGFHSLIFFLLVFTL